MGCKAINTKKSKRHSADGEETNFLPGFSLLETLLKCEKSAMGIPMNNDSAKKWHQLGLHVRQKQPSKNQHDVPEKNGASKQLAQISLIITL